MTVTGDLRIARTRPLIAPAILAEDNLLPGRAASRAKPGAQ
jgi:hypothetical protein